MFRFIFLLIQVNQKILQEVFSQSNMREGVACSQGGVNCISPSRSDVISDGMQVLLVRLHSSHMIHAPDC